MTIPNKQTPILVGAAQVSEDVLENLQEASSFADLTAKAVAASLQDTGVSSLQDSVDTLIATRTFVDSTPALPYSFGGPDNYPGAIAKRIGANPQRLVYHCSGGQSPQELVGEASSDLFHGNSNMVVLCGGEVIRTVRAAQRAGIELDWSEQIGGDFEDRGFSSGHRLVSRADMEHQMALPMMYYGMIENARRARLRLDQESYNSQMVEIMAKFSKVAKDNPHSLDKRGLAADEIMVLDDKNRMLCSPYCKNLVAKDGVNLAAALVLTTIEHAEKLGIDKSKWVYLHGHADTSEPVLLERDDLSTSKAMKVALRAALESADVSADDIDVFDLYSCFPVVPLEACDELGIQPDDPRPITTIGGLPYFGGPGNNYSMHGIVGLIDAVRSKPASTGLLYANGGWMSKHSVGIYSTTPVNDWQPFQSAELQQQLDQEPTRNIDYKPNGPATIESFIVNYHKGQPVKSTIIAQMEKSGARCYAINAHKDLETLQRTLKGDVIGETVNIEYDPRGNRYAYELQSLSRYRRAKKTKFADEYEFCLVERSDHILTVTINRPDALNALHPMANQELEDIFDCYEKSTELRVAILTGAGAKSFSAGNDLKYMASGGHIWTPESGFAGLTSRASRTKPVIAAVNGTAMGGGFEIALACDMVVAADHAIFGLPEPKVGLYAAAGGVQRLTRQIGLKRAMELILTGESIDCQTAMDYGVINSCIPHQDLMKVAMRLAEKIAAVSPVSVRSSMLAYNLSSEFSNIDDAMAAALPAIDPLINSLDLHEGSKAFIEKRPPRWLGK